MPRKCKHMNNDFKSNVTGALQCVPRNHWRHSFYRYISVTWNSNCYKPSYLFPELPDLAQRILEEWRARRVSSSLITFPESTEKMLLLARYHHCVGDHWLVDNYFIIYHPSWWYYISYIDIYWYWYYDDIIYHTILSQGISLPADLEAMCTFSHCVL